MTGVVSLHGGPTYEREPHEGAIAYVEELLEKVRSGEIMGLAVAPVFHDGCAAFHLVGRVGGYSQLGAAQMLVQGLVEINLDD